MKKLKWGKTHWDKLTKEQLLIECWKMFSTMTSMDSCLRIAKQLDPDSPYWGKDGSGGRSLEKARQIIDPLKAQYGDNWQQYVTFFRYANDLLFEGMGDNWVLCDTCGAMVGGKTSYGYIGKPCKGTLFGKKDCSGKVKKLEWDDLRDYKKK